MSDSASIVLPDVVATAPAQQAGQLTPQPSASTSTGSPSLYGGWQPALFMPYRRSIGGIVAEVTIEENASDDLTITEHPVEQGAPIADHAFKRPSTVTIRAGWSVRGSYDLSAESGIYGILLSWQAALLPFDVVTGKRRYQNMLMERLTVITDQKSEYALMADIVCRQVIIVGTQTAEADTSSENSANHSDPSKTAGSKDKGDISTRSSGDTDLEAGGGPTSGDADLQAGGGPTSGDADLQAGSSTPEAAAIASTTVKNGVNVEKGVYSNVFSTPIPAASPEPPTTFQAQLWQRIARSQRNRGDRFPSAPRSLASRTR